MNLVTTGSPNLGSGRIFALLGSDDDATSLLLPSLLRPLGAVFRTALAAIGDALGVERAADDVIAHAREGP